MLVSALVVNFHQTKGRISKWYALDSNMALAKLHKTIVMMFKLNKGNSTKQYFEAKKNVFLLILESFFCYHSTMS